MNIGERVGDYEVIAVLGVGGMGQVYKVRNILSERVEAMKILLPNLEGDSGIEDRFLREIKVQAAFDHPHIAKLNTAMRTANQLVMFMEFVDGTSLGQLLEQGGIPSSAAVFYTGQVLDALVYAHARGVVHRDIKPANIMVTPAGTVKLMDFGIARMKEDRRLTQAGGTMGSLSYMSPEQINGVELDGRADIYSLGITLYEMVTGRRPFAADSDFQLMSAHLTQPPPPPIEIVPGVPPDLNDIILMAIAKDPAQRFQSAEAFRAALSTVGIGSASAVPAPARATHPARATGVVTQTVAPVAVPVSQGPPPLPTAPAVPLGVMYAPQAPPPDVPRKPASHRGLYMALGSVATLAVLIAAVLEGPKLMRGGRSGAQSPSVAQPLPGSTSETSAGPAGTPAVAPALVPEATSEAPTGVAPSSAPASSVAAEPAGKSNAAVSKSSQGRPPASVAVPALAPVQTQAAPNRGVQTPQPQPVQTAEPQLAQNVPPQPVQSGASPAAVVRTAELQELRQRFNSLSIRASALKDGLGMMEQRMKQQGFGLRTDMLEARTRLDYELREAMQSIRNGDADAARESLTRGEGFAAKIQKFLGQ